MISYTIRSNPGVVMVTLSVALMQKLKTQAESLMFKKLV